MSRLSLRLDNGLLDHSLPLSSASFSAGGASWRSSRSLKSRRSQHQSVSCSESLLVPSPRKLSSCSLHSSSVHSVRSDTSLLSSLLDESSLQDATLQDATLVDTLWGLDHDFDPKESTMVAEQSVVLGSSSLIGSGSPCVKHRALPLGRGFCTDCDLHPDKKESAPSRCSASKYTTTTTTTSTTSSVSGDRELETSIVYDRERSRRRRTAGVLASMLDTGVSVSRRAAACVVSLLALICSCLLLRGRRHMTDVLQVWLDRSVVCVGRAAACCVSGLRRTWQVCRRVTHSDHGARPDRCGVMELKTTTTTTTGQKEATHPNGSLCDALRWLSRRWHHMTAPDRASLLTRSQIRFVLLLVPLLLFLVGPCWFGLAGLQSVLAALNITDWTAVVSDVPDLSPVYSFVSPPSPEGAAEEESGEGPLYEAPLVPRPPPAKGGAGLGGLEQSLTALWERVEAGGQRAERRHREVLGLYADLQQRVAAQSGEDDLRLGRLIDRELSELRGRLDEERRQREQMLAPLEQQSQSSRLDQLQLQLQLLAAQTEEDQRRREAASVPQSTLPAAASTGVDRRSHDALQGEVARLEAALETVRRDVDGLSGLRDGCRQLDGVQQTISAQVSAQVREEVRALVYGSRATAAGGGDSDALPESLLLWLSQQYISRADLQGALLSLERSILQMVDLRLEQHRREEPVRDAAAAGDTITREDVSLVVRNALRLFSQDQTGLADYALESGGGSVLSTRCSETYETKAALLSLFGVPLWYFSQSPRTVIQPDVHPGNCWAFRGSTGFLVIRLSMRILPTAFSLEHMPKALSPSGALHSAPRDFSVYGLADERQDRGKLLGAYTYDEDGEALQTYAATEENDEMFQIIEVKVLSNWGHQEYTCIYRVRVHGTIGDV